MTRTHKLNADHNIQYRILIACMKEQLFPEKTLLQFQQNQVMIQYQQHLLQVQYETISTLYQLELTGPIIYRVGAEEVTIETVEQLIDILSTHFHMTFHEQLIEELLHSRLGLKLSYQQLRQRERVMRHSLKFSRMPETLNFIAWLNHMNGDESFSVLGYTEGMVWEGHPSHPLTKTKLPLNTEEIQQFAPEFMKVIPLKMVLVRKTLLKSTSMTGEVDFVLKKMFPDQESKLRQWMQTYEGTLDDYRVMLVHPWQYTNVITKRFQTMIAQHDVIPTPFTIDSKATLSFRTMRLLHYPYHVKLPVNVQATSAVRTVSTVTTVDGPKLSYQLQDMLDIYPTLSVASEPYGAHIDVEADLARQFAMIVRHSPEIHTHDNTQLVTAVLTQVNPVDGQVVVDSLIEYLYGDINEQTIHQFMRQYMEALIPPLIAYIQQYGIALEAHQQNTIMQIEKENEAFSFIVRDLGGSRIYPETLKQTVPNFKITNESLISDEIEAVIAKFQHAVIQNQLGTLIHHFHHVHHIDEAPLYDIAAEVIEEAIDPSHAHADALKRVLFGDKMTVKALLNMRMEQKVKQYVQIDIQNPLEREL
ncbi:IucA/IucC family protein [Staphylococcus intermedius]|uniref:Siderophore biosynthesis protein, IucA/IucC family protein n=1 Tax=Staphylococcus intermedius NCTC 11048 TaxID=1141106 RepID=A0A380G6I5_STAIN|nr:IucA/IucC family protein [Staphylococcus intermedius]PCF63648.1 siderophore synthetase [Staphylococcus intermedius]PCF78363.1 siderophore synthetase [Staphylococcus intermedius]PCF79337.1 siderophore synthetase [Staphylococcus intermedius]PCF86928.1 siderophore synthetase [Staphylococcus intermedius]PCF90009.1 siderophore synthetase [Staphylococcus intermedius]